MGSGYFGTLVSTIGPRPKFNTKRNRTFNLKIYMHTLVTNDLRKNTLLESQLCSHRVDFRGPGSGEAAAAARPVR